MIRTHTHGVPAFRHWEFSAWMRKRCRATDFGCWIWQGTKNKLGYGLGSYLGQTFSAHRTMYEIYCGPIPEGLQLDHLCRVPSCCNPTHLEPVTSAENVRRAAVARFSEKAQASAKRKARRKVEPGMLVSESMERKAIDAAFDVFWKKWEEEGAAKAANDPQPEAEPLLSMVTQ